MFRVCFMAIVCVVAPSFLFAKPTSKCRWTSQHACRDHSIGDSCGKNGRCFAEGWSFEEPECQCYEKPNLEVNRCNRNSSRFCRGSLPTLTANGECVIVDLEHDSPRCVFERFQR